MSRRYVDEEPEFYFPEYWRKKADNVKQGSSDERFGGYIFTEYTHGTEAQQTGVDQGEEAITPILEHNLTLYKAMIDAGICAEQARMILPQNTMTEWIWSGTLFAFAKMCNLRLDSHTQKETQEVAKMIHDIAKELYPVSWKALVSYEG